MDMAVTFWMIYAPILMGVLSTYNKDAILQARKTAIKLDLALVIVTNPLFKDLSTESCQSHS